MKLARLIRIDAIDAARLSDRPPIQASPVRRWVPAWRLPRSGFGSCRRAAETPRHQDGFALTELDKVALQSTWDGHPRRVDLLNTLGTYRSS